MMWKRQSFLLYFCGLLVFLVQINANPIKNNELTEFILLHNNDIHARFEQTSVDGGKCTSDLANTNKCYGGLPRVAHEVRKFRKEAKNGGIPVLYLNAGDTYTGTTWFTVFKDNITATFLNKLKPDAISLGNHEFDENVKGLVSFLNKVHFPVLAANLDMSEEPDLAKANNIQKSKLLRVGNVKIAVIGYLTTETKVTAKPNKVKFLDEIKAINKEAERIKKRNSSNIIIALGHAGYKKDQEIAMNCPDVDLVIGGHSHTFLYNGSQPDAERIEGPYPTLVTQPNGKQVPVVQAYAYTKYLGKLHVKFDRKGNLVEFDGNPILLNASIPRDDELLQLLEVYRPNVTALETVVGHTKVHLEGRPEFCRKSECNLGNMLADSMIYARVSEDKGGSYWTDAPIAFVSAGGIRSSIGRRLDGSIQAADLKSVLSFGDELYVIKITGKTILKALEHSASMEAKDSNGGFLQMSGVQTVFDYNKDIGKRVVSAHVRCGECEVPNYEPLQPNKIYNVIIQKFLLNGGDGHNFKEDHGNEPELMYKNDYDTLLQYVNRTQYVYPGIEQRIIIVQKKVVTPV